MLQINERYEVDRSIFKCDYIRYTPTSLNNVETPNTQTFIDIPKEDDVNFLRDSYFELDFKSFHNEGADDYVKADIRLVNLAPIAFFKEYKLTTKNGKH